MKLDPKTAEALLQYKKELEEKEKAQSQAQAQAVTEPAPPPEQKIPEPLPTETTPSPLPQQFGLTIQPPQAPQAPSAPEPGPNFYVLDEKAVEQLLSKLFVAEHKEEVIPKVTQAKEEPLFKPEPKGASEKGEDDGQSPVDSDKEDSKVLVVLRWVGIVIAVLVGIGLIGFRVVRWLNTRNAGSQNPPNSVEDQGVKYDGRAIDNPFSGGIYLK